MADLPLTVGAALPVEALADWRDWLFERGRDLELQSFHAPDLLDGDWQGAADVVNRTLAGFRGRIGIHGPFLGFGIDSMDPAIREVVTRRMMQALDVCAAVGATQMVVHSPYNPWTYNNLALYESGPERVIECCHLTLAPVVSRAESQGVVLVIENIADKDARDRNVLIDSFGSTAVRASVDTGHAHLAWGTQGAQPVDYFIKHAGARLAHVHLQDADGYADRHWAIGEGTIRWAEVFRCIAALEETPRLILELFDKSGIGRSVEFLAAQGLAR